MKMLQNAARLAMRKSLLISVKHAINQSPLNGLRFERQERKMKRFITIKNASNVINVRYR